MPPICWRYHMRQSSTAIVGSHGLTHGCMLTVNNSVWQRRQQHGDTGCQQRWAMHGDARDVNLAAAPCDSLTKTRLIQAHRKHVPALHINVMSCTGSGTCCAALCTAGKLHEAGLANAWLPHSDSNTD